MSFQRWTFLVVLLWEQRLLGAVSLQMTIQGAKINTVIADYYTAERSKEDRNTRVYCTRVSPPRVCTQVRYTISTSFCKNPLRWFIQGKGRSPQDWSQKKANFSQRNGATKKGWLNEFIHLIPHKLRHARRASNMPAEQKSLLKLHSETRPNLCLECQPIQATRVGRHPQQIHTPQRWAKQR